MAVVHLNRAQGCPVAQRWAVKIGVLKRNGVESWRNKHVKVCKKRTPRGAVVFALQVPAKKLRPGAAQAFNLCGGKFVIGLTQPRNRFVPGVIAPARAHHVVQQSQVQLVVCAPVAHGVGLCHLNQGAGACQSFNHTMLRFKN